MKWIKKDLILLILGILLTFGIPFQYLLGMDKNARPRGQFKGAKEIESHMANHYFNDFDFYLGKLIGISSRNQAEPLSNLLGGFQGIGANQDYVNGKPNALNTFLWDAFLISAANATGEICVTGQIVNRNGVTLYFKPEFVKTISELCENPQNVDLLNLWESLVGFEAYNEFTHWEQFASTAIDEWEGVHSSELVSLLMYTAIFNPYFILEP